MVIDQAKLEAADINKRMQTLQCLREITRKQSTERPQVLSSIASTQESSIRH